MRLHGILGHAESLASWSVKPLEHSHLPGRYIMYHQFMTQPFQDCFRHEGNIRFRALINTMLSQYTLSSSKKHKMQMIQRVVQTIIQGGGRFLKKENRRWYDGGIACGKDKVSCSDCV